MNGAYRTENGDTAKDIVHVNSCLSVTQNMNYKLSYT
jgi:hypothetical protein